MSTSSESAPPPTPKGKRRSPEWTYLLVNAAVLPGLGSIAAKRRAGFAQAALALAGVGMTMFFAAWLLVHQLEKDPTDDPPTTVAEAFEWERYKHLYYTGLAGMGLVAVAWAWSVMTAISIILRARKRA